MGRQNRGSTPGHKTIDSYWKQQALTEGFADLVGDQTFEVILERAGNHCYACGVPCTPIRAHILPHTLGGTNTKDNLFLLCGKCHADNPDTIYSDMFFRYVKSRPFYLSAIFKDILLVEQIYSGSSESDKKLWDNLMGVPDTDFVVDEMYEYLDRGDQATGVGGVWTSQTKAALIWKNALALSKDLSEA